MKIDKRFFKKHQKILLQIINTRIGRWLFGVERMGMRARGKKIVALFPNAIRTIKGYEGIEVIYETQFFNRPEYAVKVGKVLFWMPIKEYWGKFNLRPAYQLGLIFLIGLIGIEFPVILGSISSNDFNSNSAGDGSSSRYGVTTWSDCRSGNGNYAYPTGEQANLGLSGTFNDSGTKFVIRRGHLPFNTSSLPDGDTIFAAVLKLYVVSTQNAQADGSDFLSVVQGNQASVSTIAISDYQLNNGTTEIANRIDIDDLVASAYNEFVFNDTGKSFISKTGYTKIGTREGHDLLNTAFTHLYGYCDILCKTSEHATYKPVLSVTHGTTDIKNINGLTYASMKTVNGLATASMKNRNGLA